MSGIEEQELSYNIMKYLKKWNECRTNSRELTFIYC